MNVSCTVSVYSVRDPAQSVTAVLASVHHQDDLLGLFLGVNLRLLLFKARESPRSAASRLNGEDFMYLFIFFGGEGRRNSCAVELTRSSIIERLHKALCVRE